MITKNIEQEYQKRLKEECRIEGAICGAVALAIMIIIQQLLF